MDRKRITAVRALPVINIGCLIGSGINMEYMRFAYGTVDFA